MLADKGKIWSWLYTEKYWRSWIRVSLYSRAPRTTKVFFSAEHPNRSCSKAWCLPSAGALISAQFPFNIQAPSVYCFFETPQASSQSGNSQLHHWPSDLTALGFKACQAHVEWWWRSQLLAWTPRWNIQLPFLTQLKYNVCSCLLNEGQMWGRLELLIPLPHVVKLPHNHHVETFSMLTNRNVHPLASDSTYCPTCTTIRD